MPTKPYWQSVFVDDERSRAAVVAWFSPLSDGLTPYKAEILCDVETDREKKMRAFMANAAGKKYVLVRTRGGKFSISIKPIAGGA